MKRNIQYIIIIILVLSSIASIIYFSTRKTTNICDNITCKEDEICDKNTGKCIKKVNPNKNCNIYSSLCKESEMCNTNTGECIKKCNIDSSVCKEGEVCNTNTGECIKKCNIDSSVCKKGEVCNTNTGECIKKCNNDSSVCKEGEMCNKKTGECEPNLCKDIKCKKGEVCNKVTGECIKLTPTTTNCNLQPSLCKKGYTCLRGNCLQICNIGVFEHIDKDNNKTVYNSKLKNKDNDSCVFDFIDDKNNSYTLGVTFDSGTLFIDKVNNKHWYTKDTNFPLKFKDDKSNLLFKINALCSNNSYFKNGKCVCNKHYSGDNCEIECNNQGLFRNGECQCMTPFYTGDNCDILCNNHGTPNYTYNICTCDKGWIGPKCETGCNGHGIPQKCRNKDNTYSPCCDCFTGYTGDYCEIKIKK